MQNCFVEFAFSKMTLFRTREKSVNVPVLRLEMPFPKSHSVQVGEGYCAIENVNR